jgi:hypothetical protein
MKSSEPLKFKNQQRPLLKSSSVYLSKFLKSISWVSPFNTPDSWLAACSVPGHGLRNLMSMEETTEPGPGSRIPITPLEQEYKCMLNIMSMSIIIILHVYWCEQYPLEEIFKEKIAAKYKLKSWSEDISLLPGTAWRYQFINKTAAVV